MLNKLVFGDKLDKHKFQNPDRAFGIMPFWFWNGELEYAELARQVQEFKDKGVPGFFIHSRYGIEVPYLSEEWFEKVRHACQQAKLAGMQAWIYDEHNWPSGTTGGELPRRYPELQQQVLQVVALDVKGPQFLFVEAIDSRYVDLQDADLVAAFAVPAHEYGGEITKIIDLTEDFVFDRVVACELPLGSWKLLCFIVRKVKYYVDALNPVSTERFIAETYEKYKQHVGLFFGEVLPGFYTDEPTCFYFNTEQDGYAVPWSREMLRLFEEANGYDLRPCLPALFFNIGPQTSRIRLDFWRTISMQYNQAYFQQIAQWCRENGLLFTGHLLHEDRLRSHARNTGNIFHHLKHMDIVGVDHLYRRIGSKDQPELHVAAKFGSSAAHHTGKARVLCESLAGTQWDLTMTQMKWIADWEYVLGINMFNPHGFHYSIEGDRKRDWPPSQFYHHTWWKYYGKFNEYLSRNGYMLSGGRHVAKVAVLYPIHSMWANYTPQSHNELSELIEQDFNYLADALLRLHFDYDFIDEDVFISGQLVDGKLNVRDEAYELVILPAVTNLSRETMHKLKSFVRQGGKLMATSLLPTESLQGEDDVICQEVAGLLGVDPKGVRQAFLNGALVPEIIRKEHENGGLCLLLKSQGLAKIDDMQWLDKALRECITPDVELDDPGVFYLHRVKDERDIYFFVNTTGAHRRVKCRVQGLGAPKLWDAESGSIEPIYDYALQDSHTEFSLELSPFGSALVVLDNDFHPAITSGDARVDRVVDDTVHVYERGLDQIVLTVNQDGCVSNLSALAEEDGEIVELGGPWSFTPEGSNTLLLTDCKLAVDYADVGRQKAYYSANGSEPYWRDGRFGQWEYQLPHEFDSRKYPVVLWYRTEFCCEYIPENLRLVVDGFQGDWEIYLNGQLLEGKLQSSDLDCQMGELPIAKLAVIGQNTLVVRLTVSSRTDGILDPIRLRGDFSLRQVGDGYVITKLQEYLLSHSWTEQGYPFYSGTALYEQEVELPQEFASGKVFIDVPCGEDVLEVMINDELVGVRLWPPYRVDISAYLRPGRNKIGLRITNTVANALQGKPIPSGMRGPVKLIPYNTYTLRLND